MFFFMQIGVNFSNLRVNKIVGLVVDQRLVPFILFLMFQQHLAEVLHSIVLLALFQELIEEYED